MFGRKTKELRSMLDKSIEENAELRKRIEELEKELAKMKEQEASVVRAITEAGKAASRIEQDANAKRDELIKEAQSVVSTARENADEMVSAANNEASVIRKAADEYRVAQKQDAESYSEQVRKSADEYSERTHTDANLFIERSVFEAQKEVRKRKDVVSALNEMLRNTTEYLTEQNNAFIEMLNSVIEDNNGDVNGICREVEKCSCSCGDCANPCSEIIKDEVKENDPVDEAQVSAGGDESFPDEYDDPADLMMHIYKINNIRLPEIAEEYVSAKPEPEKKPQPFIKVLPQKAHHEPVDSELPHDASLSELVSDVIEAS